jgi:alkylhydroperoxidase family enzyme
MSITTTRSVEERRALARVPLDEPSGLLGKAVAWYSRRTFGDVPDTALALLHNSPVLKAVFGYERNVAKWHRLDPNLKVLAEMAAAAAIGCSWCMDFGYYVAHSNGLRVDKLREVPRWRQSDAFGDTERRVLEYAEAMTATPPTVTDELAGALRSELGDDGFVELTAIVALENQRSRINSALGLVSQGFSDRCELPGGNSGAASQPAK